MEPRPPPEPVTAAEIRATLALLGFFLANILLAVVFASPFKHQGLQAFQDPDDVGNSLWYIVTILVFTFVILWIAKKGKKWLIRAIILFAVASTISYVVYPLVAEYGPASRYHEPLFGLDGAAAFAALLVAGTAVLYLYRHPEWYVVDAVGLLVASGSAAIFGISLGIVPVLVLLAALAIYDAIAVYRTKHMLSLADTVIDLRLPVLLVIPKHSGYRFRQDATRMREAGANNKGARDAMFMGLGDLVMPTILVVSALQFAQPGWGALPALGASIGIVVGFAVLMWFVLKGNPQAGLPLLNGGAIVGFLGGILAATGTPGLVDFATHLW